MDITEEQICQDSICFTFCYIGIYMYTITYSISFLSGLLLMFF